MNRIEFETKHNEGRGVVDAVIGTNADRGRTHWKWLEEAGS